jgi:hypothetical protein
VIGRKYFRLVVLCPDVRSAEEHREGEHDMRSKEIHLGLSASRRRSRLDDFAPGKAHGLLTGKPRISQFADYGYGPIHNVSSI